MQDIAQNRFVAMISALAFPFFEKFLQELFHNIMSMLGQFFARFGKHAILQKQKLFVKMIDRWTVAVFVSFKRVVLFRRLVWIMHGTTFSTTIRKRSANTDCTNGIKFVGIMDNFAFNCIKLRLNMCASDSLDAICSATFQVRYMCQ